MLTIGRLADYVGVTPRAIRLYHQRGLLPEPERTPAGYRVYTAQDVVDLRRIKVLTDAGVPLARIKELLRASPRDLAVVIDQVDADLRRRIVELRRTRAALAMLPSDEPLLPPSLAAWLTGLRGIGVGDRTLSHERDSWTLIHVLFPDLVDSWLAAQVNMMTDPQFTELYLLTEAAFHWEPDDPRLQTIACRTVAWMVTQPPPSSSDWDADPLAYELITTYRTGLSPAWDALTARIQELVEATGYGRSGTEPESELG